MFNRKYLLVLSFIPVMLVSTLALAQAKNLAHIADLEKRFGSRLIYKGDSTGRALVEDFHINCNAQDGRSLPLKNLLLARLASEDARVSLRSEVHVRGGDIRVVDVGTMPDKSLLRVNALQISKFGDVKPISFSVDSIYNACMGSYGPIWAGGRR